MKTITTESTSDAKTTESGALNFDVTNPDEVPREFMTVDADKVRAWIAAGGRAAPGLRVFEE